MWLFFILCKDWVLNVAVFKTVYRRVLKVAVFNTVYRLGTQCGCV